MAIRRVDTGRSKAPDNLLVGHFTDQAAPVSVWNTLYDLQLPLPLWKTRINPIHNRIHDFPTYH
jgi:hypothetical protein